MAAVRPHHFGRRYNYILVQFDFLAPRQRYNSSNPSSSPHRRQCQRARIPRSPKPQEAALGAMYVNGLQTSLHGNALLARSAFATGVRRLAECRRCRKWGSCKYDYTGSSCKASLLGSLVCCADAFTRVVEYTKCAKRGSGGTFVDYHAEGACRILQPPARMLCTGNKHRVRVQ